MNETSLKLYFAIERMYWCIKRLLLFSCHVHAIRSKQEEDRFTSEYIRNVYIDIDTIHTHIHTL